MTPSEEYMKTGFPKPDQRFDELASMGKRPIRDLNFQSASEYCCAKLLEKYAGWQGLEGITFQIAVGRAVFDFRIQDTFIEYHPISLRRECLTDSLSLISSAVHRLPKDRKLEVLKAFSDELEAQYEKRRGQVLAAHPTYSRMELICVSHPEGFIEGVIKRFSPQKNLETKELLKEFRELQRGFKNKL